ncbi:hypothetical protein D0T53_08850 [Dysgonomonas sp. 216]|uniref:hypothetical protein n=1 Tax=Dysgonomonas sp. 216 TaxID=2302934 RepID=UPI0013D74F0D|nr:hypothetical protein [Dysgonomonas sp. 216]NDW19018.1 hypothetical protein [Dysgonomonas sp. 216]
MKKIFLFLLISTCLLFNFSCDDGDNEQHTNPIEETKLYLPMQVGNYWVYDKYIISPDGKETFKGQDSLRIKEERTFKEKTFFVFEEKLNLGKWREVYTRTDSNGYLISETGQIYFSNINFKDTLAIRDDIYFSIYAKMEKVDNTVSVPAGSFNNALNFNGSTTVHLAHSPWAENAPDIYSYYAKNIGIICYNNYYLNSPDIMEYRLAKCYVNGKTYPK